MTFKKIAFHLIRAVLLVCAVVACGQQSDNSDARSGFEEIRGMLHVDLQEGFENDTVLLRLDDKTIYERTGVSTDMRISRADSIEMPLAAGSSRLSVSLPDRNVAGSIVLAMTDSLHVGVSIQDGSVEFTVSDQPFGYL